MQTRRSENSGMNNSKTYVKIGRMYQGAFESICNLVERGGVDRSVVQSCRDRRWIETEQYIFEYTGDSEAIDTGTQLGMMPSGASWFMGFRGSHGDNVMGAWLNLIELVSTNYHKEYSLVEYIQPAVLADSAELNRYKELVFRVMRGLRMPATHLELADREDSKEDVYAVTLRLELFNGVGEPRPLLCKLYFRKRGNTFYPVNTESAKAMDEHVSTLIERRGNIVEKGEDGSETEIVDNVLNSISKLITGELENNFSQCVLVTNSTDEKTLEDFGNSESTDEVELECKKLKVLSISHICWYDTVFNVYFNERKAFKAKVGANDSLNLYCCCGDGQELLIENNLISCKASDTGISYTVRIDTSREDLGISGDQFDMIQAESSFADHNFLISCSELSRRHIDCSRYRCKCNSIAFEVDGKIRYKCSDCPYPEVVFRYPDGRVAYTPSLDFDTLTLSVTEEVTDTCRFCGRSYKRSDLSADYLCPFCNNVENAAFMGIGEPVHKQNYKRYAGMIPLSKRAFSFTRKKYCFENADRICFVIGKNKYFFDKLKLKENGIIEKPEKRQ